MTERFAAHLDRFLSRPTGGSMMERDIESLRCWTQPQTPGVRFDDSLRVVNAASARQLAAAGGGLGHVRFTPRVGDGATATPWLRRSERFDSERLLEALGRIWASGVDIDFDVLDAASGARGVPPTDHCDRRDCWSASPVRRHDTASAGASTGGVTGNVPGLVQPALEQWPIRRATSAPRRS